MVFGQRVSGVVHSRRGGRAGRSKFSLRFLGCLLSPRLSVRFLYKTHRPRNLRGDHAEKLALNLSAGGGVGPRDSAIGGSIYEPAVVQFFRLGNIGVGYEEGCAVYAATATSISGV